MNTEQFRKAGYQAIDRICDYYNHLEKLPVTSMVEPGYLTKQFPCECHKHLLRESMSHTHPQVTVPEQGEDFQNIADDYQKLIVPGEASIIHQGRMNTEALSKD
ncbi:hypothetical protein C0991_007224 [Blastosporella zonata]|nr:hypothetical protein C0991_007224 [Blastosporella zonata]